jgi:hypothetical protein
MTNKEMVDATTKTVAEKVLTVQDFEKTVAFNSIHHISGVLCWIGNGDDPLKRVPNATTEQLKEFVKTHPSLFKK